MNTRTDTTTGIDQLQYVPEFAGFILRHHLEEFSRVSIQLGYEINPPLMNYFRHMSEEEFFQFTLPSAREFLTYLAENRAREFSQLSLERWKTNQLPVVTREDIVAEDITLVTMLRKRQFLHFVPMYTTDMTVALELIKELDAILGEMETTSTNTYIYLLKGHIEEHAKKLEKSEALHKQAQAITHLANYYWDLSNNEIEWSDEMYRIYGLEIGSPVDFSTVETLILEEDRNIMREEMEKAIAAKSTFDFYYRINCEGQIKILHARGQVQPNKKNEAAAVVGTVQDVTEKQTLIRELRKSNILHHQAEELAGMGTWNWDVKNNKMEWTDELYRIYGMKPQEKEVSIDDVLNFVHPEDRELIRDGIDALYKQPRVDYSFRILTKQGQLKWLRTVAKMYHDTQGNPEVVIGTEIDITERQMMIQQLTESERLNKQAQSLAHLGNWTYDIKTGEFTWSDEMFRIYEMESRSGISTDEWASYIVPEEKDCVIEYQQECIREKKAYDRIYHLMLPNGKRKTVHRKGEFIFNENGEPVRMIGTTQDITEQDRVQQELKDNQTFIRKITDATPSIIASYNVNTGQYVFVSQGFRKLLGYEPELLMHKGIAFVQSIMHPDDVESVMEKNREAMHQAHTDPEDNSMVIEFTYRMRHQNGEYRWFHTYGTIFDRNAENQVEHVLNITLDVTDQVEAAEKIREQEHFIQQIADASPTILYLFDVEQQKVVYINREIFFVLGHTPDEILDTAELVTEKFYHPEDFRLLPERKEGNKSFTRVDTMIQYECRMKHKDGDWRWLLVREIAFKTDEHGKITQILGAALDINRRKEMEKTILQNTLQLEQSNASLEEFAYVASHDLKEPLRKIATFGDRLMASQADNLAADGKIYLSKIIDASQRMQTMITDLLSISMISGNHSFEEYSLKKVLEEVLQTLEFKIEQQDAIIHIDDLPVMRIVASQMRQLFQNLLSNSLKFVAPERQPEITISCTKADAAETEKYNLVSAPSYYKITVSDNGIGFENEFAGKIFAIFQRLHGRSEYEGSGIGLAICKKIVEHHGGVIFATGELGVGATFTIILPA
ncbi:MAG: PAS domain-containing sensor histidine kinase [Flavisolibacter sp.]